MAELPGLSCSLCHYKFKSGEDQSIRQFIPRILPCGHTFCTGCLEKWAASSPKRDTIICPDCRKESTSKGVTDLPKNFQVLTILESIEKGQTEAIQQEKDKNLCPKHKGAIPVYCYKDSSLFCIYCEVRAGKHTGHWCELATDIATPTLEGLCRWSKEIADNHETIKKLRKKVNDTKDSIVKTQQLLKNRISKDMEVLNDCLKKLQLLDAQESLMKDVVNKCEEAYNLIQRCQNNEIALVEVKFNFQQIKHDLSTLLTMLEPAEISNFAYFVSDIQHTLEKPGQKGEPLAGLHQSDSCESGGADSWKMDRDDVSEHSDIVDNEEADGASVGDEDNDEELEGAVGGTMLFSTPERQESQESPNPERKQTSLLDELQKEIDRLHLLNPGGEPLAGLHQSDSFESGGADSWKMDRDVVPGHSGINGELEGAVGGQETRARQESRHPTNLERKKTNLLRLLNRGVEVTDGPSLPREPEEPDSLPLIRTYPPSGHQPLSLPCFASLPGQSAVTTDSFSRELTRSFVPNFSKTHLPRSPKKRVEVKKAPKEEVFPWECKRCTMLNGPQVLVCLGCEALRETEAQEGRNVCPMCTLVNEPGKTKCELCETLLVKQEEQSSPDD